MLLRKNSEWRLYPHKVKYIQNNEEIEQWALPDKQWWIDFADKWEHTEIIEFEEIQLTAEQVSRFNEIRNMPEDFMYLYIEYILTGDTSDDIELPTNHPFQIIRLRQANNDLKQENTLLKAQAQANADTSEFHEELIVELAMQVYD